MASPFPLVAVDVGNSRAKFGLFLNPTAQGLPRPVCCLHLSHDSAELDWLSRWLAQGGVQPVGWWIGSVNRPASSRLVDWLRSNRPDDVIRLLAAGDLPLAVAVERPDMVGVDRLLDALAANGLRTPTRPAVVVDVGTAITVDLVSREGVFMGGAIVPGIGMSAKALHAQTDLLPLVEVAELAPAPAALGRSTEQALRAGLFWGAVGAIRELIARLEAEAGDRAEVFLTGGAGPIVARLLGPAAQCVPHLTLAGIALAAQKA